MDDCFVIGDVDVVLEIGKKLMRAMTSFSLQVQHKKTPLYMPEATEAQARQHVATFGVSSLEGAGGAAAGNGILVLGMHVGTDKYIWAWRDWKAKTLCRDMKEVAEDCSGQIIDHMLKSIVSKNSYLKMISPAAALPSC